MLCDRVAILDRGRLQGCGELREILSLGVSATEIVLDNPSEELLTELHGSAARQVKTGKRVRLEIADEKGVPPALETILRAGARIVSLNPVKMSLEDYFMARVGEAGEQHRWHGEIEITAGGKR